jgi:asparagine synthase (glutamine-hydrolysing)
MCGICGVFCLDGTGNIPNHILQGMIDVQKHRGPDDQGIFQFQDANLGFCRLAIIDLSSTGHQPMTNENNTIWLVFNGEIYNFRELIPVLEQFGHQFRSRSDSEVIIHAYEQWGTDCIHRFNGMFSFVIWDSRKRRAWLVRDRLGVKPLYYWSDGKYFAFASELKSLLVFPAVTRALNYHAIQSYMIYEYIPAPLTIFEGIQKLLAGHSLDVRLDGSAMGKRTSDWNLNRYWDLQCGVESADQRTELDCKNQFRILLTDAVKRRLISDVPLGAFLSGGIDSSSIVALMSELMSERPKTFSIGFQEQTYNELPYAQIVADKFHTDHHVEILHADAEGLLSTVADYMDEPFADASVLPFYLVCQMARKYVTVALSGDGGDEIFAGYEWYRAQRAASLTVDHLPLPVRAGIEAIAHHIPPSSKKKGLRNMARRFLEGAVLPQEMQHVRWQRFWQKAEMTQMLAIPDVVDELDEEIVTLFRESGSSTALDQQQYVDVKRYLADDILFKVDRMSMANSLETRGPFLDYTVVEFAMRLPQQLRMKGFTSKVLLKQTMESSFPNGFFQRPKLGFNIPYKNWLRNELRDVLQDALHPSRLQQQGIFIPSSVQLLMKEHIAGTRDHAHKLWQLLMFQLWAERFLEKTSNPVTVNNRY